MVHTLSFFLYKFFNWSIRRSAFQQFNFCLSNMLLTRGRLYRHCRLYPSPEIKRMKIGICLPYMKAGLTRDDYLAWFRRVDQGPFHSISCGERIHGPSYDMRVILCAAARSRHAWKSHLRCMYYPCTVRYGWPRRLPLWTSSPAAG